MFYFIKHISSWEIFKNKHFSAQNMYFALIVMLIEDFIARENLYAQGTSRRVKF